MKERFKVLSSTEAINQAFIQGDDVEFYKNNPCWLLFEFDEFDKKPRPVGQDGGEPEDQLLVRDWKWVAEELNKAYERGRKDGISSILTQSVIFPFPTGDDDESGKLL
jgi:hypothetical protein